MAGLCSACQGDKRHFGRLSVMRNAVCSAECFQVSEVMASVSQYFYELAEEIPDDKWKDVAHHLGLKRAKVSAIDAENRYLKEKNMKTLEAWRLKNGRNATIPCLKRALHAAEVGWVADSVIDGND
uniref:Death domain-containing protein n=1 Tax=Branchiostoma floridae TaxID=7739 RepID=C3ZSE6_BRAFL|eukprot:XP_002588500.1 hypothetical protein BRAFLDRAFT_79455 [Branchiostoma floridae]